MSGVLSGAGELVTPSKALEDRAREGSNDCVEVVASCDKTLVRLMGDSLVVLMLISEVD
jgi:hypothetical protein